MKGTRLPWTGKLASVLLLSTLLAQAAPPNPPANLRSSWVDTVSSVLTWDSATDANSFNIYRYDSTNQNWSLIASQIAVPFFRETPTPESPVNYAVTAVNVDGESSPSTTSVEPGGWPDIMISYYDPGWDWWLNGRTSATLQFAASPVSGVDAVLEFGPSPEDLEFRAYHSEYAGFHTFLVTNLTPATLYYYRYTYSETNRLGMTFSSAFYTLPPDMPPQVFPVEAEMDEDQLPIFLFPNGWDQDTYGPLTLRVVRPPGHGTVQIDENNTQFTYTPAPNFFGVDSFDYVMNDGELDSEPATVTITVHSVNDPGLNDTLSLELDTPEDTAVAGAIFISDVEGDPHTLQIAFGPESGSVQITGTNFVFTPLPNFHGQIHFGLIAADDNGVPASGLTYVAVNVTDVDDPPVALAQSITTSEDTAISVTLGASDVDGGPSLWSIATPPSYGTLSGTAPDLIYTPAANFSGPDNFVFSVDNGATPASTATVSIQVIAVNDAPLAQNSTALTSEDNALVCPILVTDVEGDALTFEVVRAPAHGTLGSFTSAPYSVNYLPVANFFGTDSFDLRATDGVTLGNVFTITVNISAVDDAPVAIGQTLSTPEDQSLPLTLTANDIDGGPLSWQITTPPAHGFLTGTAPNLTYIPDANYFGPDAIAFSVDNGQSPASQAIINLQITAVDDAPVALAQNLSTSEDQPLPITLSASDIDGGPVTYQIITPPNHGTLSGTAPNLTYTPAANYNGSDSLSFRAASGNEAVIAIQVTAVNDAPIATPQSVTTAYNNAVSVNLSATDIDSPSLTYTVLTSPANGVLSGTAPNLVFTPTIGWSGTTTFTFRASDGQLNSAAATVTITVQTTSTTPTAPSSLTAQAISNSQINLTWNDNSNNEDGFAIERSTGSTYTQIATVGPNVRNFSSTGLSANKSYNYRVRAFNIRGNSAYSNIASAKTLR